MSLLSITELNTVVAVLGMSLVLNQTVSLLLPASAGVTWRATPLHMGSRPSGTHADKLSVCVVTGAYTFLFGIFSAILKHRWFLGEARK